MTYASWEPRYRVTTIAPGKLDLFVFTFIDGLRATIDPITNYEEALAKARGWLRDRRCQIKVLPVTGEEARNLLGVSLPERPEPMDAALRQQMVTTLKSIARESNDGDARADAFDLLTDLGALQP